MNNFLFLLSLLHLFFSVYPVFLLFNELHLDATKKLIKTLSNINKFGEQKLNKISIKSLA